MAPFAMKNCYDSNRRITYCYSFSISISFATPILSGQHLPVPGHRIQSTRVGRNAQPESIAQDIADA